MIVSLYGQPGSGKTTLAKILSLTLRASDVETTIIDGDELREILSNKNFSRAGREQNIRAANSIARFLSCKQRPVVILAIVNPYAHLRAELKQVCDPGEVYEVYLESTREIRREFHVPDFEVGEPDLRLNTDRPIIENVLEFSRSLD